MNKLFENIKVVAFDADDTLWDNEHYFREAEEKFAEIVKDYLPGHTAIRELYGIEIKNLSLYGYGIKSFTLSMIEAALSISSNTLTVTKIEEILAIGKDMLTKPVNLIANVKEVLNKLNGHYRLVVATKGDLRDQEKKLGLSGLSTFFHHTEVMSEKNQVGYEKLIRHLDIKPNEFLMIGNSIKSDILPVLEVGGVAVHVPYHITWEHEKSDVIIESERFFKLGDISEFPELIFNQNA